MKDAKVSWAINLLVLVFWFSASFVHSLYSTDLREQTFADKAFDAYPLLTLCSTGLIMVAWIILGSKIFQLAWNILVVDIFSFRKINYKESIFVIIVLGIFSFS